MLKGSENKVQKTKLLTACLREEFLFITYLSITLVRKGLLKTVKFNLTHLEKLFNIKKIFF